MDLKDFPLVDIVLVGGHLTQLKLLNNDIRKGVQFVCGEVMDPDETIRTKGLESDDLLRN